ncbi:TetR/AcrR family transcriptional regulator [Actinomadura sp. 7K507]|uniref:TetR/AcrR family transcriptional regulator n=1 Tax=Actinomadura sp. 7K507 TaxID=2530365 RepID=UPI00104D8943|nr:TetR/AcrR family transcriptional regulator [Actinomadura sp. 7K507]TDC92029.1 TetR/AcrR family transcriptional regulator [Actinomadura sp. 7K507]
MASRLTRGERRRALENRLLDAVQRLDREGVPFSRLTVETLAAEAGSARSTFYFHFADKAALVRALGERLLDDLGDRSAVLWNESLPGRRGLYDAVRGVMCLYRDRYPVFAALAETAVADAEVNKFLVRRIEAISDSLAARIEHAQRLGVAGPVLLPETAHAFVTLLERTCYNHLRGADDASLDRHAEVLTTIIWNTVVSPRMHGRADP